MNADLESVLSAARSKQRGSMPHFKKNSASTGLLAVDGLHKCSQEGSYRYAKKGLLM